MSLDFQTVDGYRSGFVALIGRPNVGKSTLLNKLIGEKVAITSPIAQTTRNRLRSILTTEKAQVVFVDTPGIHKPHHLLGERLVQSAKKTIGEVDAVLLMLEGCCWPGKGDAFIMNLLSRLKIPVLVVLNKWDLVAPHNENERKRNYQQFFEESSWPIFNCSAITGQGCSSLVDKIETILPLGHKLYPSDIVCDQPQNVLMGEFIREQVLINTREEIPHSVAVSIERVEAIPSKKKANKTGILATIYVERKSQKAIIIGKGGSMLKTIGQGARKQIEILMEGQVYLELFVKVVPKWRSKPSLLAELGYLGE